MKLILSLLVLFSSTILNSKEKLEIYFNSRDCANCNNLIRCTKIIDPKVEKYFYLSEDNESIVEDLFRNLDLSLNDFSIRYLTQDYFYNKKTGSDQVVLSSFCVYVDGSQKKDSFSLKDLPGKISLLKKNNWQNSNNLAYQSQELKGNQASTNSEQSKSHINSFTLLIPDSIKISKQINIFVKDSIVNILDVLLNKNITLFLNKNFSEVKKIIIVKGSDLSPQPFMLTNCFDTAFYRGFYPKLKRYGQHVPKLHSAFISDSAVNLLLVASYPRYPDPKTSDSLRLKRKVRPLTVHDTIVGMKYFVYSKNLRTKTVKLQCINKESFENEQYWLTSLPFFIKNGKLSASIHSWDKPESDTFLCEFKTVNNTFEFDRLHRNETKNIQVEKLDANRILGREVNNNFYFTTSIPFILDFKTNQDFLLDKNDFGSGEKIFIHDLVKESDQLYLLVSESGIMYRYTFNYQTKKKEDKQLLELAAKPNSIKFLTTRTFLVVDGNNLQILNPLK